MIKEWHSEVTIIINRHPRIPKCQGMVGTVEKLLGVQLLEEKDKEYPTWPEWLPVIHLEKL